jgi:hypothetical protein
LDTSAEKRDTPGLVMLMIGLILLVYQANQVSEKYGHFDAWWFWNVRANFLTSRDHWLLAFSAKQYGGTFTVPVAHSDYPPFLPLMVAFFWRTINMQAPVVPYAWSTIAYVLISTTLFVETRSRSLIVASIVLLLFATNTTLISLGTAQTADVWIALFLLLAYICYHHSEQANNSALILFSGAMFGAAAWTKNEGLLLLIVFLLFHFLSMWRRGLLGRFFLGLSLPLFALIGFKIFIAPANDFFANQQHFPWENLFDTSRYSEIFVKIKETIQYDYAYIPYLLIGYFFLCLFEKRRVDKSMLAILTCFLLYLSVYVFSPFNVGWHVQTSSGRLIFQLLPTTIWIIALRVSDRRFRLMPVFDRVFRKIIPKSGNGRL